MPFSFLLPLLTILTILPLTHPQQIMVGGYTPISNLQDQGLIQASNFVKGRYQQVANATIARAQRQIVSGINYRIFYSTTNGGQYQADVFVPLNGNSRLNSFMTLRYPNGTSGNTTTQQNQTPSQNNQQQQQQQPNPQNQQNQTKQNPGLPPQNNNSTNSSNSPQNGTLPAAPAPATPTLPPAESYPNSSFTQVTSSSSPSNTIVYANNTTVGSGVSETIFPNLPITSPTLPTTTSTNNSVYVTNNVTPIGLPPVTSSNSSQGQQNNNQQNSNQQNIPPLLNQLNYPYGSTSSNQNQTQVQPQTPGLPPISPNLNNQNTNTNLPTLLPQNNTAQQPQLQFQTQNNTIQTPPQLQTQPQTLPQNNQAQSQSSFINNNPSSNQQSTFATTPLYPLLTEPTSYQYNYAQSSQQGTLNVLNPTQSSQSQSQISSSYPSQQSSITNSVNTKGCEMMNNSNTRCIICKGGFYLGTKGICGVADPMCLRFNPQDYSCLICALGYSFNGNFCSG